MFAGSLSVCLQEPVLLNQQFSVPDSSGHVEDVMDVVGSGLQLYGKGWRV